MSKATTFKQLSVDLRALKLENTPEVRRVLADSLIPLRDQVRANVHSVSGRTVAATVIIETHGGSTPAAAVKVDKRIASVMWRGRPYAYPRVVNFGHGGAHPAGAHPFFSDAVESTSDEVAERLTNGLEELIAKRADK